MNGLKEQVTALFDRVKRMTVGHDVGPLAQELRALRELLRESGSKANHDGAILERMIDLLDQYVTLQAMNGKTWRRMDRLSEIFALRDVRLGRLLNTPMHDVLPDPAAWKAAAQRALDKQKRSFKKERALFEKVKLRSARQDRIVESLEQIGLLSMPTPAGIH